MLGAPFDKIVFNSKVLDPNREVCDDGCRLLQSDRVSGLMRGDCTQEKLLGPMGLAQRHLGRAHVVAGVHCIVLATCGSLVPFAGLCVLHARGEQPSARCGDTCVIEWSTEGMRYDSIAAPDVKQQAWSGHTLCTKYYVVFLRAAKRCLLFLPRKWQSYFISLDVAWRL